MSEQVLINEATLTKLQAATGIAFGSYLTLHLIETLSAHFGEETYNSLLDLFRKYYHNRFFESLILASAGTHMIISLYKGYLRGQRLKKIAETKDKDDNNKEVSPEFSKANPLMLHRYAGYVLASVIAPHVLAVRGMSLFYGVFPDFTTTTWTLRAFPFGSFYIYYSIFGICGLYHLSFGAIRASQILKAKVPTPKKKTVYVAAGIGAAAIVSAVLAFAGAYFPVKVTRAHEFTSIIPESFLGFFNKVE